MTGFEYFLCCPQPSSFSTDVKDNCIRGTSVWVTYARDTWNKDAYTGGTCIGGAYNIGNCIRSADLSGICDSADKPSKSSV